MPKCSFGCSHAPNAPETCILRLPNVLSQIDRESLASTKICTFLQKWHVFARNVLWNMKFRVSLVSLFKIRTSIICNLWKRGNNVPYFQQRLHLLTQYVSCRAGRYCIFTCVFGAKIRDFQQSHAWTPLKRLYCVPRTFLVKTDRKLSVPTKNNWISSKTANFFQKMCHGIWNSVFYPFRCSKSARRLFVICGTEETMFNIFETSNHAFMVALHGFFCSVTT